MLDSIYVFIFKYFGWKMEGEIPSNVKKSIIIVAPHAAWVDFPVGLFARASLKTKVSFLGKSELFKGAFGFIFTWLGGKPVDRFSNNGMVDSVVKLFNENASLHIALAPEGTRKEVTKLRTGFYYIALEANVPIIMVVLDYPNKRIIFRTPFYMSGRKEEDLWEIAHYYDQFEGVKKQWIHNYLLEEA